MKRFACILAVVALCCASANAAVVTYNGALTPSTVGSSVTTDLPMFSGPGTLTAVQVTLNFSVAPYAQVANFTNPAGLTFTTSDYITFGYTNADIWTVTHGSDSWTLAAPAVSTGNIYGSNQLVAYFNLVKLPGTNSAPVSLVASGADLAGYVGGGTLAFGTSGAGTVFIADGALYGGGGGDLTGTASVQYTYDVPEPATLAILGLGGLLLRRRLA